MALRRPPTTFSDSIDASDLAANSVTASELADNAVDANAIAANAVTTAKIADSTGGADGITTAKLATDAVTSAKIATGAVIADGIGTGAVVAAGLGTGAVTATKLGDVLEIKPHIIPGMLYPAYLGNKLDGTATAAATVGPAGSTVASSKYGTVQSDGRMYYFTDIKGSEPIHDPRIGAHFGSQRHKIKSMQLLESETAINGNNVYSIDGRKWARAAGYNWGFSENYGGNGLYFEIHASNQDPANHFIEVTGYFNAVNMIGAVDNATDQFKVHLNGTANGSITDLACGHSGSPMVSRYVDHASVYSLSFDSAPTLGINTFRFNGVASFYMSIAGFELIAQDTSSSANRSKLQIHGQKVVSYGKKFTVAAATPHYDPFNGFTNSSGNAAGLHSTYVDAATSLGLSTAPGSSASWAISGTNNIRPYNGGRVVKWIDSSGAIKTSVNMMPPNAQNALANVAGTTEVTTPSATNATNTPIFSDDAIDDTQAEGKTFHILQFGNGSANGNASWKDATTPTNIDVSGGGDGGFVMDDALTACAFENLKIIPDQPGTLGDQSGNELFLTFIGTGVSIKSVAYFSGKYNVAQNLPYGTHVLKLHGSGTNTIAEIDGVVLTNVNTTGYGAVSEMNIMQPKRPPIPENAVVIADYMLMADFVAAGATASTKQISKGVRRVSCSRDWKYNLTATLGLSQDDNRLPRGGSIGYEQASAFNTQLHYFGTHAVFENHPHSNRMNNAVLAGSTQSLETNTHIHISESTMGVQDASIVGSQSGEYVSIPCIDVHTPIHTSSHYQWFETPYTHDLLGGDRNMEQTNLVVTADGKTWDELTRDTSYIGDTVLMCSAADNLYSSAHYLTATHFRGAGSAKLDFCNKKYFAHTGAPTRWWCLETGYYILNTHTITNIANADTHATVLISTETEGRLKGYGRGNSGTHRNNIHLSIPVFLEKGDKLKIHGGWYADIDYSAFWITKATPAQSTRK